MNKKRRRSISISENINDLLVSKAKEKGITINRLISHIITDYTYTDKHDQILKLLNEIKDKK